MSERVRIAATSDLLDGESKEVVASGKVIALYRVEGKYYAIDGVCPHAGGPLGQGVLAGCIVTCPWHGWQFDVTDGKHCLTPNIKAESFPVIVEENDIFVDV